MNKAVKSGFSLAERVFDLGNEQVLDPVNRGQRPSRNYQ
jgi:hypothetical protein